MEFLDGILDRARKLRKTIVFPEGHEPRILEAVHRLNKDEILNPILLGNKSKIVEIAGNSGIDLAGIEIIDPESAPYASDFAEKYYAMRKHKGVTPESARNTLLDPVYFGTMMLKERIVDGYLAGAITTTSKTVQAGLRILRTRPGVKKMSSFFFMVMPDKQWGSDGILVMADPAIVVDMDAPTMAEIAVMTARNVKAIAGFEPRVAMLSYSTLGSGSGESVEMVRRAVEIAKDMLPGILLDGELQADAALIPAVAKLKAPASDVAGNANTLIFPGINAANIGYKLVQRLAGAKAVGPILQGLSKPANDLSRGCSVEDIIYTAAITALQSEL